MDAINRLIVSKMKIIQDVLTELKTNELMDSQTIKIQVTLDNINSNFLMQANQSYMSRVPSDIDYSDLDCIVHKLEDKLTAYNDKKYRILYNSLTNHLKKYPTNEITVDFDPADRYDLCVTCNMSMKTDYMKSCLYCDECGLIRNLDGLHLDEPQMFGNMLTKTKVSDNTGKNVHFNKWWDRINAQEPDEQIGFTSLNAALDDPRGEKLIITLSNMVVRDNEYLQTLTIDKVKGMLKELGRTKLYENSAKILKLLTGIGPPTLPAEIYMKTSYLFNRILEIRSTYPVCKKKNNRYYPYYIMKILDAILPYNDLTNRRILFYIHMQGKNTVEESDNEWEKICYYLDGEIEYSPTIRDFNLQYAPWK